MAAKNANDIPHFGNEVPAGDNKALRCLSFKTATIGGRTGTHRMADHLRKVKHPMQQTEQPTDQVRNTAVPDYRHFSDGGKSQEKVWQWLADIGATHSLPDRRSRLNAVLRKVDTRMNNAHDHPESKVKGIRENAKPPEGNARDLAFVGGWVNQKGKDRQ